ncbi:MAG: serine/threonine protein kinase [Agarilytica sp.]
MKIKTLVSLSVVAVALAACGGGDINVDAQNNASFVEDNSVGDGATVITGGSTTEEFECASYIDESGDTQTGQIEGENCIYGTEFVNFDNPILTNLTLTDIGDGAHIFTGSLYMGENYDNLADATTAGITQGGDGPTLNVRAGATIALSNPNSAIAINRGAQIVALGRADAPITFTSESDILGTISSPEAVQEWGGMVIAGFGFINSCDYEAGWDRTDNDPALTLVGGQECSLSTEGLEGGREVHYGGTVPTDSSGQLSYVVVKHAGFEVSTGNELNGITFGAVGSSTILENLQIYSNKDDGVEFFGGGANLTNYVAMYVRDDSIDIDQGYYGTISNALVIQGGGLGNDFKTGNHCVESDGSGSGLKAQNIANGYTSRATINNLTCILSAKHGDADDQPASAGINMEEGHELTVNDSIVTTAYGDATTDADGNTVADFAFDNYCFQMEDTEDLENAGNGFININTTIFACNVISSNKNTDSDVTLVAGTTYGAISGQAFLEAQDNVTYAAANDGSESPDGSATLNILDTFYSVPVEDLVVNGVTALDLFDAGTTVNASTTVGAVTRANDWTTGWVYGLVDGNRGQALWFE